MTKCSMQKKIESFKKVYEYETYKSPQTKQDVINAIEKIREGWWELILAYGDFGSGNFFDMLQDIDGEIPKELCHVWGMSLDEVPMDEWADYYINAIKNYKAQED